MIICVQDIKVEIEHGYIMMHYASELYIRSVRFITEKSSFTCIENVLYDYDIIIY